jgi:hypothetical protein
VEVTAPLHELKLCISHSYITGYTEKMQNSGFCNAKQVFPGGWTAVLVSLDNIGIWNLRAEKLDNWYRGQEVYVKVLDPLGYNITEMVKPDNALYCGLLEDRQKYV